MLLSLINILIKVGSTGDGTLTKDITFKTYFLPPRPFHHQQEVSLGKTLMASFNRSGARLQDLLDEGLEGSSFIA